LFMAVALVAPLTVCFAGTYGSGSSSDNMLLLDRFGRVVEVPTNEVPSELRPTTGLGLDRQIPNPTAGSSMPLELLQRLSKNTNGFQFFSAVPPQLMPYLASQDEWQHGHPARRTLFICPAGWAGARWKILAFRIRFSLLAATDVYIRQHDRRQKRRQRFGLLHLRSQGEVEPL
jgi:hypothetical protein